MNLVWQPEFIDPLAQLRHSHLTYTHAHAPTHTTRTHHHSSTQIWEYNSPWNVYRNYRYIYKKTRVLSVVVFRVWVSE